VIGVAERALAPETSAALSVLARNAAPAWAETFDRLTATLDLRARMFAELVV
jgi:hypothetical protein